MPVFILRGACRAPDGQIGPPLFEETITAASPSEAVRLANAHDLSTKDERANALWLVDAQGVLHWSLRRADRD
ncbi:hypothetical protein [Methylorubrum extorquens]|uniref:hypothetical protein n=1 Tax=Methylorubrum extorquens TaxID=408 RepID=UPI001EE5DAF2|nr:hypothetical protein [Methylorubrum extorquens]MCG5247894.1 hypothetical protein [Methylorubrum extorquens]